MREHLREAIRRKERLAISSIVLYEWLRGPRLAAELSAQEALFPSDGVLAFGADEARVAAALYRDVRRGRGREIDLAIAATALVWNATLWTLNVEDFGDVPGLNVRETA